MREDAERGGRLRLVEMLQRDERALGRILAGLEQLEAQAADRPKAIGDLRDLAEGES